MAFEDFNSYTEVDPNSRYTISGDGEKITVTALQKGEDSYIYDDKGVDFFDGDFEHLVEFSGTYIDTDARCVVHSLSTSLGPFRDGSVYLADTFAIDISAASSSFMRIIIYEVDGASVYVDNWNGASWGTPYYGTFYRDPGVGTYGTLYLEIYSDSLKTTLVYTLSITLHSSIKKMRYSYGTQSWGDAGTQAISGYTNQLDLQLTSPAIFRRRIEGY